MAPSDQLEYQLATLRGLVAGTRPDQLSAATPCANWDVRDLFNHFVGGAHMFAGAFRGEAIDIDPDAPMPDMVGPDALASFDAAVADFSSAIDTTGAMDQVIKL